jgi:hypothetical protein
MNCDAPKSSAERMRSTEAIPLHRRSAWLGIEAMEKGEAPWKKP